MIKNEIIYNKNTWNQYLSKIKRIETKLIYLLPPPCCVLEQDTLLPESTG